MKILQHVTPHSEDTSAFAELMGIRLHCKVGRSSYLVVLNAVLDVDEAHNFELPGQLGSPVTDDIQTLLRNGLRWNRASRIPCAS